MRKIKELYTQVMLNGIAVIKGKSKIEKWLRREGNYIIIKFWFSENVFREIREECIDKIKIIYVVLYFKYYVLYE